MTFISNIFSAQCQFNGVERKAVSVKLTATSEEGSIRYEVSASFFPHKDSEDYAVSCDACVSKELYYEKGRRSKKREKEFLAVLKEYVNQLAEALEATIHWDQPLREARYG